MKNLLSVSSPVAVLFQARPPPPYGGLRKPMKPGGYCDSGADIAYNLHKFGVPLVVPGDNKPNPANDLDWVFPDTEDGISLAIKKGAKILWANTLLYESHPIQTMRALLSKKEISIVGQKPCAVQKFDDKFDTNEYLRKNGIKVPNSFLVGLEEKGEIVALHSITENFLKKKFTEFPIVLKPVYGRGSQGVTKVDSFKEFQEAVQKLLSTTEVISGEEVLVYGHYIIAEQYLDGEEICVTIMPPGIYKRYDQEEEHKTYWALPGVKRFNHINGIAPYNGIVAVVNNSKVLTEIEEQEDAYVKLVEDCKKAAQLVDALSVIRIDCRASNNGYYLFDLNMKPNMTGTGRPGRDDQDSLVLIAARNYGWKSFNDLIINMLLQKWSASKLLE